MPKTDVPKPEFEPGDICTDADGAPGIITHHAVCKAYRDTGLTISYKGVHLSPERIGQSWSSRCPALLFSLGDSYYRG